MCFVFGSCPFRSGIWSVDDYDDDVVDDDDDDVAMWQCGTQNEGPTTKNTFQLSTATKILGTSVGFLSARTARNSGIGGCGQQGLRDLLANAGSARRLTVGVFGRLNCPSGSGNIWVPYGSMIVLRSVGEKNGHLYHLYVLHALKSGALH